MNNPYGPPGGPPRQWGPQQPYAPPAPQPYGAPQQGWPVPQAPAPHGPGPRQGHPVAEVGFPEPAGNGRKKRSPLPWILGGLGVVAFAAVLFLGFVVPGWFYRTVFDAGAVQKGVEHILRDSYGVRAVGPVTCPPGEPVEPSHTFDCRVSIDGRQQSVTITVTDAEGTYQVGRPK